MLEEPDRRANVIVAILKKTQKRIYTRTKWRKNERQKSWRLV